MTDSAYVGSESTYSECETFTDEDTSALVHPELQSEGSSAVPSEGLDAMEGPGRGALLLLPGRSVLALCGLRAWSGRVWWEARVPGGVGVRLVSSSQSLGRVQILQGEPTPAT